MLSVVKNFRGIKIHYLQFPYYYLTSFLYISHRSGIYTHYKLVKLHYTRTSLMSSATKIGSNTHIRAARCTLNAISISIEVLSVIRRQAHYNALHNRCGKWASRPRECTQTITARDELQHYVYLAPPISLQPSLLLQSCTNIHLFIVKEQCYSNF